MFSKISKTKLIKFSAKNFFKKSKNLLKEVQIFINNKPVKVDHTYSIFQACHENGEVIPRFCFHEKLSVAGNCRMCLVEVEKSPKPIAACALPVIEGMRINTKSDKTRIARGGVMEFLLANHPLDCPICDQGGECDLQDISEEYGYGESRFYEYKRGVEDKHIGPLIKTTMTRCIHCTRCIRFTEEVAGDFNLGTTGRGRATEVGTYVENLSTSELSSNIVDLCPVGALTNKPYAFKARPWELKSVPSVDILDTILPEISVDSRGVEVMRILPRINEDVNEEWISDKSRHSLDGNKRQRLTVPLVKNSQGILEDVQWDKALEHVVKSFEGVKAEDIQVLIGNMACLESIVATKDLFNRLDVDNISLGRNNLKVDSTVRTGYLMNSKIRGVEDSDLLLLVGINPRYESPVLNARIRKAVNKNGLKVGLVGSPYDFTYDYTHCGSTTKTLLEILNGTHTFSSKIARANYPMLLIGSGILEGPEGSEMYKLLLQLSKIGKFINPKTKWNGFNILHNNVSTIGALELGINPNYNEKKGKLIFSLGYDEFKPQDIPKDSKLIYIGSHGDKAAELADIVLPGATYLEKSATYVSTEGRVEVTRPGIVPPFLAREDWEVVRAISESLDLTLPYDSVYDVRSRLAELAPHLVKYKVKENSIVGNKNLLETYENENIKLTNKVLSDKVDVNFYFRIFI